MSEDSKGMDKTLDDLEAIRSIFEAVRVFNPLDQKRILAFVIEKLNLTSVFSVGQQGPASSPQAKPLDEIRQATDIKSFLLAKQPKSENQLVAAVAYYYQFEAPPEQRKEWITANDVLEACRLANWTRPSRASQVLVNALAQGLLDRGPEKGQYKVSTVGENLVAVVMPGGAVRANGSKPNKGAKRGSGGSATKGKKRAKSKK